MSGDRYVGEQLTAADIPTSQATDAEVASAVSAHVAAADPHPGYVLESREGQANGIGTLGPDGRQPAAQRPNPSWTTFPGIASEAAMLALSTAIPGDQAIRTDFSPARRYTLSAADYTQASNWYLDSNPFGTILGVASGDITGVSVTDGGAGNAGKAFIGDAGGRLDGRDVGADGATLDAHVANVSNPHSVTAVQVGADPVGSAASALSSALSALTSHTSDTTDAHLATAIGFTPDVSGDWSPAPTTDAGALNQAASRIKALEAGTGNAISFNGRTGAVSPADGDYSQSLITGLKTSDSPSFVRMTSTQATGTAPFTVSSTTKVDNLHADKLDGADASQTPTASTIPIAQSGNTQLAQGWTGSNAGGLGRALIDLGDGTSKFVPVTGSGGVTVTVTSGGIAISGSTGGSTTSLYSASGVSLTTTAWYRASISGSTDALQTVTNVYQSSSVSSTYDASDLASDTDLLTRSSRVEMDPTAGDTYVSRIVGTSTTALLDYCPPQWTVAAGSISASGNALVLNGSTYITSSDARLTTGLITGTGDWTIEGWIQGTSANGTILGGQAITGASSNSSWCIAFGATTPGKLELYLSTSGSAWTSSPLLTSTTTVNDGTRRHFAIVRNGGTMRMYIGGTQQASSAYAGSIFASTRPVAWGGFSDGSNKSTVNAHFRISDSCLYPSGTGFTPADPLEGPTWPSTGYGYSQFEITAAEVDNLSAITLTETTPNSSTNRYAFSFDDGVTWETYNGSVWSTIALADIPASGMTGANVQTYLAQIETEMQTGGAVTKIAYGMTSNGGYAPTVDPSFGVDSTLYTSLVHGTDFIRRVSSGAVLLQAVGSTKSNCIVRIFG